MPETGEQLKVPERKLYTPQEGLSLIKDHLRQTVEHPSYVAPWRPILLIRDREGIKIPSYYRSIFVPDKESLGGGLPGIFSGYGFDFEKNPAVEKKTTWSRYKNEFKPGFVWKDGILVPNVGSAPVSKLESSTDNQVTDFQADTKVYGGNEAGVWVTRTVYEDGETAFDRSGRIEKEVGRQEVYRIHRADAPGSIPPQPPLGLGWAQVPLKSL